MVKENCGIIGIYSMEGLNVIPLAIDALRALQHRGQEAWGIAVPGKAPFKRIGLVSGSSHEFKKITTEYASPCAIGHVRYSTIGKSSLDNAQPLKVKGSLRGAQRHHSERGRTLKPGGRVLVYASELQRHAGCGAAHRIPDIARGGDGQGAVDTEERDGRLVLLYVHLR